MRTPLHTRVFTGLAAAVMVGALVVGYPFAGPVHRADGGDRGTFVPAPETDTDGNMDADTNKDRPAADDAEAPVVPPPDGDLAEWEPAGMGEPTDGAEPDDVPDPDHIGPCPKTHSRVVRRALSQDGRPTWWHADGSITQRVVQTMQAANGKMVEVPGLVLLRPADVATRAAATRRAKTRSATPGTEK